MKLKFYENMTISGRHSVGTKKNCHNAIHYYYYFIVIVISHMYLACGRPYTHTHTHHVRNDSENIECGIPTVIMGKVK